MGYGKGESEDDALQRETELDYNMVPTADWVWITVDKFSVRISRMGEAGVGVDIYRLGDEMGKAVDTACVID